MAGLHGLEAPDWWRSSPNGSSIRRGSRSRPSAAAPWSARPAAFLRHGALPDPMDLDARGGEPEPW